MNTNRKGHLNLHQFHFENACYLLMQLPRRYYIQLISQFRLVVKVDFKRFCVKILSYPNNGEISLQFANFQHLSFPRKLTR